MDDGSVGCILVFIWLVKSFETDKFSFLHQKNVPARNDPKVGKTVLPPIGAALLVWVTDIAMTKETVASEEKVKTGERDN